MISHPHLEKSSSHFLFFHYFSRIIARGLPGFSSEVTLNLYTGSFLSWLSLCHLKMFLTISVNSFISLLWHHNSVICLFHSSRQVEVFSISSSATISLSCPGNLDQYFSPKARFIIWSEHFTHLSSELFQLLIL